MKPPRRVPLGGPLSKARIVTEGERKERLLKTSTPDAPPGAAGSLSLFSEAVEAIDPTFKALSLWQPHATAIALGIKRYETRSWATSYRGPLLVCGAKKKFVPKDYDLTWFNEAAARLKDAGCSLTSIRYGEAMCLVDLVDCIPTERLAKGSFQMDPGHRFWGDFAPGRFAFQLERVRKVWPPLRVVGRQGFWDQVVPHTNEALR